MKAVSQQIHCSPQRVLTSGTRSRPQKRQGSPAIGLASIRLEVNAFPPSVAIGSCRSTSIPQRASTAWHVLSRATRLSWLSTSDAREGCLQPCVAPLKSTKVDNAGNTKPQAEPMTIAPYARNASASNASAMRRKNAPNKPRPSVVLIARPPRCPPSQGKSLSST